MLPTWLWLTIIFILIVMCAFKNAHNDFKKYKIGQKFIQKTTNQLFVISNVTGFFKHNYILDGPNSKMKITKHDLETKFLIASEISRIRN